MGIQLGYACINTVLRDQGIRIGRSVKKKTYNEKGLEYIGSLVEQNVDDLYSILEWNVANNIKVFRLTGDITPWGSEYKLQDLPNWTRLKPKFEKAGMYALDNNVRLSFHPGQYCCLGSAKDNVILHATKDLEMHGRVMDALLQPKSRLAKINIHLGGAYGDKHSAINRFISNYNKLSNSVRSRLTLENDDRASLYTVRELHDFIHVRTGIPIVFDYHHHAIHPGEETEQEALELACSTWKVKPCTHYSESAQLERGEKAPFRAHSKLVYSPINAYGLDIDCVVEAKSKEQAVLHYRELYGMEQ